MKKKNVCFMITLLIGFVSAAFVTIYLFRDYLKESPIGFLFEDKDTYEYFDEEFTDTESAPEETEVVKEKATKVRRGYIPLQFHKEN